MPPTVYDFTSENPDQDALTGEVTRNQSMNTSKSLGINKPPNINFHEVHDPVTTDRHPVQNDPKINAFMIQEGKKKI